MSAPIPRLFVLRRDRDITGVSGAGDVADGVQWPDGSVVLRWRERPSTAVWDSLDVMLSVHGHDGATRAVWADHADQRREALADIAEMFGVATELIDPEAERAHLHRQIERAIQAVQDGEAAPVEVGDERIVKAVMPLVGRLLEQRDRAQRAAGRAYKLADRWEAAHGSATFLVRIAGGELREALDDQDSFDGPLVPAAVMDVVRQAETEQRGMRGDLDADQLPLNQGPLTGIEVRDPCPYSERCPLVPRACMLDHIRQYHREVRVGGPGIPLPAADPDGFLPTEACPHCDRHLPRSLADGHVATVHADLPPCTATLTNETTHGTLTCVFRAGHREGEYGDFHASAHTEPQGRTMWNDSAHGATPHQDTASATEPTGSLGPVTHLCPPAGWSTMPCCGRSPFEAHGDRITIEPAEVTCAPIPTAGTGG